MLAATNIKTLLQKSINKQNHNSCKYYAFLAKKAYLNYFNKEKYCNCIQKKDLFIEHFLKSAIESESFQTCSQFIDIFSKRLDLMVVNLVSCN